RAFESLARLNAKVTAFDPTTLRRLSRMATNTWTNDGPPVRRASFNALVFEGTLDAETERRALRDVDSDMRRLATVVLANSGAGGRRARRHAAPDGARRRQASSRPRSRPVGDGKAETA